MLVERSCYTLLPIVLSLWPPNTFCFSRIQVAQVLEAERLLWSQHLPACLETTSQALTAAARDPSFSTATSAAPAAAASVRSLVRRYAQDMQRKNAVAGHKSHNSSSTKSNNNRFSSVGPRGASGNYENTNKDVRREVKPVLYALPPPPEERSPDERAALKKQGSFGIGDDNATSGSSSVAESEMHLLPLEAPMASPLVLK